MEGAGSLCARGLTDGLSLGRNIDQIVVGGSVEKLENRGKPLVMQGIPSTGGSSVGWTIWGQRWSLRARRGLRTRYPQGFPQGLSGGWLTPPEGCAFVPAPRETDDPRGLDGQALHLRSYGSGGARRFVDEAYLPAQSDPSPAQAWLSLPEQQCRRPQGSRAPQGQGASTAGGYRLQEVASRAFQPLPSGAGRGDP